MHGCLARSIALGVAVGLLYGSLAFGDCPSVTFSKTWTTTGDFDEGWYVNANGGNDELQINGVADLPPYIWVACSDRGTVVRIATRAHYSPLHDPPQVSIGQILGEYSTAPDTFQKRPSRTTVDFDGNVWVGNRGIDGTPWIDDSVVKVGTGAAYQWVDRDPDGEGPELPNGVIDTSTEYGTVLGWLPSGAPRDELVLLFRGVPTSGVRTVAVDRSNNVWIGGYEDSEHGLLDGRTGATIREFVDMDCGGYGGLIDRRGVLWSSHRNNSRLLCFDVGSERETCLPVGHSYGLAVDLDGMIWNTREVDATVRKIDPLTWRMWEFSTGGLHSKGVSVTPVDNHVWIANQSSHTVSRLDSDGTLLKVIALDQGIAPPGKLPTGVAVDADGFVWVTNRGEGEIPSTVMRIDPNGGLDGLGAVDTDHIVNLGVGADAYNYSDMTGMSLMWTVAPAGTWLGVVDAGEGNEEFTWERISWEATPGDGTVLVQAWAANVDTDLGAASTTNYVTAQNGGFLACTLIGRYLEVRVQLNAAEHNSVWPTLQSLTASGCLVLEDDYVDECDDEEEGNGIPDHCEPDCNDNGWPDSCDIEYGPSYDCNGNDVPDECEDCDANGVPDYCEVNCSACPNCTSCVTQDDCNGNGIPDPWDIACTGAWADCPGCGDSEDCNENDGPGGRRRVGSAPGAGRRQVRVILNMRAQHRRLERCFGAAGRLQGGLLRDSQRFHTPRATFPRHV
ncbi:MAG TPA: hypothetical protein PKK06_11470 [Phycisphaerae bacterium]|nr:hypothetical protein [Phycisphaerae bacterium]HNU45860.1 hypothetical protein [Phycisphaerae bacterium]